MGENNMIRSFNLNNFGVYEKLNWKKDFGEGVNQFKKVNIIYGENYSGKTTLSRLFHLLSGNSLLEEVAKDCSFEIFCDDEKKYNNKELDLPYKIIVYNSDFIEENLKWLIDDNAIIKPFTIMGKESIEIDNHIQYLQRYLKGEQLNNHNYNLKYNSELNNWENCTNVYNNFLTQKAKEIRSNQSFYGKINYDRNSLLKDLECVGQTVTGKTNEDTLIERLSIRYSKLSDYVIQNIDMHEDSIFKLLRKIITNAQVVEQWKEDEQLSKWIEEAMNIHQNKFDNCQFCGGRIDDSVYSKIKSHFTKESDYLRKDIGEELKFLITLKSLDFKELDSDKLIPTEKENVIFYNKNIKEIIDLLNEYSDKYNMLLNNKLGNMYNDTEIKFEGYETRINNMINENNSLYNEIQFNHNSYVENINDENLKIREQLLEIKINRIKNEKLKLDNLDMNLHDCIQYCEKIKVNKELWKNVCDASLETIEYLKKEIKSLESKLKQEQNAIEGINDWIQYFFNRDDIKMELDEIDGRVFFKVMRNDKTAFNLSEGERRILSFCYFLTTLKDQINQTTFRESCIIYIDDPISSLDQKHIFSIFSSINSYILKNEIHQLFISTHSLEFLKYLNRLEIDREEVAHYIIEK